VPAATAHPAPDISGVSGRPAPVTGGSAVSDRAADGMAASPSADPGQQRKSPADPPDGGRALLAAPFPGGPEQSRILGLGVGSAAA
jgi:hypothetical protein